MEVLHQTTQNEEQLMTKFTVEYLKTHPGFYWMDCNYNEEVQVCEIIIDEENGPELWLANQEYAEEITEFHARDIIDICPVPEHVKIAIRKRQNERELRDLSIRLIAIAVFVIVIVVAALK